LRVLHVRLAFAPDPVGGTEIYVEALAQGLRSHAIESVIAAPSSIEMDELYEHNGLAFIVTAPQSRVSTCCGSFTVRAIQKQVRPLEGFSKLAVRTLFIFTPSHARSLSSSFVSPSSTDFLSFPKKQRKRPGQGSPPWAEGQIQMPWRGAADY